MTVSDWKVNRFSKTYKGYDVRVLKADGTVANGNLKLSTVRKSYEEGDDAASTESSKKKSSKRKK